MGVIGGKDGAINGIPSIKEWGIGYSSDTPDFGASGLKTGTSRVIGVTDWSGSYTGLGSIPAVKPGETFSFLGSIDGAVGASGTAIVDSVDITGDLESGDPIGHTVAFSANGVLTLGAAIASDLSIPCGETPIGGKIEVAELAAKESESWVEVDDIRNWSINISSANQEYSSSGTAGGKRRVQGRLDSTISFARYTDNFSDLIAPNSVRGVRIYVDDTRYWQFRWMMFGEASDLTVNIEEGAVVGATQNAGLAGTQQISAVCTLGDIIDPDGTTWWPAPAVGS